QHFLKVAIADRIATIPAHRPQDHITLEMAPLEIRHRSVRPISAKHAQASRFLQQSRNLFFGTGGCAGTGSSSMMRTFVLVKEVRTTREPSTAGSVYWWLLSCGTITILLRGVLSTVRWPHFNVSDCGLTRCGLAARAAKIQLLRISAYME